MEADLGQDFSTDFDKGFSGIYKRLFEDAAELGLLDYLTDYNQPSSDSVSSQISPAAKWVISKGSLQTAWPDDIVDWTGRSITLPLVRWRPATISLVRESASNTDGVTARSVKSWHFHIQKASDTENYGLPANFSKPYQITSGKKYDFVRVGLTLSSDLQDAAGFIQASCDSVYFGPNSGLSIAQTGRAGDWSLEAITKSDGAGYFEIDETLALRFVRGEGLKGRFPAHIAKEAVSYRPKAAAADHYERVIAAGGKFPRIQWKARTDLYLKLVDEGAHKVISLLNNRSSLAAWARNFRL